MVSTSADSFKVVLSNGTEYISKDGSSMSEKQEITKSEKMHKFIKSLNISLVKTSTASFN